MMDVPWGDHSVPRGLDFLHDSDIDLESSLPLYLEEQQIRRRVIYTGRKNKSTSDEISAVQELSTDEYTPGVLKIFGDKIVHGVEYKSVLASKRSTAVELVKQALERYGLPPSSHSQYVLCDVVGTCLPSESTSESAGTELVRRSSSKWRRVCSRVISEYDRPLLLQNYWKPGDGHSRRYELRMKSEFSAIPSEDDTYGLNENARRISMSKLRRGAIPSTITWQERKIEKFADQLNLDGTLSRIKSPWMVRKTECNKVLNGLNVEHPSNFLPDSFLQNKKQNTESFFAPTNRPFLLTLRGCDPNRDPLFHVLQSRTTLVCNSKEKSSNCIRLFAPDIHIKHCHLHLRRLTSSDNHSPGYNYCLELECVVPSNIRVNGYPVSSRTTVQCGDILSLGNYYVFLFKDLTAGMDIPADLLWLGSVDSNCNVTDTIQYLSKFPLKQNIVHVPPLMLSQAVDDSISVSTVESTGESVGERFRFAYARDKEEEVVKAIAAIIRQNSVDFSLAPAFLYSMCIEYACHQKDRHHIRNLLLRILVVTRENVAELSKALQNNKFNCGLIKSKKHITIGEDYLKSLLRWMSNCVQLILYLRGQSSKYRAGGRGGLDDDTQGAFHELASGLEEIVVFCFQQTVYTITKALYMLMPAVLDSNPFSENHGPEKRGGVWKITMVLDVIIQMTSGQQLHTEVAKQLFMYIFFFCSTSVFNRLFLRDAGSTYYNWTAGVRIRANIGELEEWATRNGLDEEFNQIFEKLLTAAELLSTSKSILLKYDWMNMRVNYHPLNEAQLHRLLQGYSLGGKSPPYCWNPPPEDRHQALQEDEILLEMSGHPPFLFPQDYGVIDLAHPPDDTEFWAHFKKLYAQYGIAEDDSDIGSNASYTPQFVGSFPKVELQKSFFSKPLIKQRNFGNKPSPRRVQFAPTNLETDSDTHARVDARRNLRQSNASVSSDSVLVRGSVLRCSGGSNQRSVSLNDSADRRLDELITNGLTSDAPVPVKGDIQNIRCLSPPPPLPPRHVRENSLNIPPDLPPKPHAENIQLTKTSNVSEHSEYLGASNHMKFESPVNDDDEGEYMFPKNLLVNGNKQILENQQQNRMGTRQQHSPPSSIDNRCQYSPSSPRDDVFSDTSDNQDVSPRSTSNPVFAVSIAKGSSGLGLGLIDGLYTPLRMAGIYIRKILAGSPAEEQGQITVGDRLLCVNGKSIVGADYQSAMRLIRASGENLTLLIAKGNDTIAAKVTSTNC
ncbi:ras-associating and dilute domain-containing protein-like [Saccostrea echinata]|uniref:ras-associating and dilute domain-containing protein-like n=1 Tax=Saccostrea echinata TaxID=191078 RepID=UPI002A7FD5E8|nr:ras-associating and dilute domain-containing protein-like [Saccostrea echinata]